MDYRDIIRGVREDRDDTQARIGEVLHKSRQGYSHIESGRAELKIDDLIKLCKFYNLSADYLIGLTSTPRAKEGTSIGRAGGCVPSIFVYTRFCRGCHRPAKVLRPTISSRHFTG
ncbi:MAG: helix-turn-helix domain-containing protein [Oscillospiraceae bacterium]